MSGLENPKLYDMMRARTVQVAPMKTISCLWGGRKVVRDRLEQGGRYRDTRTFQGAHWTVLACSLHHLSSLTHLLPPPLTRTHSHARTHTHTHTHTPTHTHVYADACTHTNVHTHTVTYIGRVLYRSTSSLFPLLEIC